MNKRANQYHLTLQLDEYANGEKEPAKKLELQFSNHDELFDIIDKVQAKNIFSSKEESTEFALGLKLFSEVMLKNRNHPLFEELNTVFPMFMNKLKAL